MNLAAHSLCGDGEEFKISDEPSTCQTPRHGQRSHSSALWKADKADPVNGMLKQANLKGFNENWVGQRAPLLFSFYFFFSSLSESKRNAGCIPAKFSFSFLLWEQYFRFILFIFATQSP
ncbi:hypothetical protein AVEN_111765-1 [Araneus ventricosus]|uniref:Uncharacterized protein n=1 Tax=Araneus ventricosus TaxID=182803 RepID=A0A4Y2FWB1_ARAVE|nr:hypothetical protein AVEN_111765-1 [Araneus ventricosus]